MVSVIEGTATGLLTSFATNLITSLKKKWSITDKKKKLEEVLILIHSVLDATDGRAIQNPSLKIWQDKIKQAAELGDYALTIVKRDIVPEKKAEDLGFTFYAASFARKLFTSGGGDTKELDFALEKLEDACRDLLLFLKLIELDASFKKDASNDPFEVIDFTCGKRKVGKFYENLTDFDNLSGVMDTPPFEVNGSVEAKLKRIYSENLWKVDPFFINGSSEPEYIIGGFNGNPMKGKYVVVGDDDWVKTDLGISNEGFDYAGNNKKMKPLEENDNFLYDIEASLGNPGMYCPGFWDKGFGFGGKNKKMKLQEENGNGFYNLEASFGDITLLTENPRDEKTSDSVPE